MNKKQTVKLITGLSLLTTLVLMLTAAAQESVQIPSDSNKVAAEQQKWLKDERKKAFALLRADELTGEQKLTEEQKKSFAILTTKEIDEIFLAQLRDKNLPQSDPRKLVAVVIKTGERKIVEAIPELINLLLLKRDFDWENKKPMPGELLIIDERHRVTPSVRYPAVGALGQIGQPALPALLEVVKNRDDDSLESQNALEAIQVIFYPDSQQAADFLRQQADESVASASSRLYTAAEKITKKIEH